MRDNQYDFGTSLVTGIVAAAAVTASTAGTAVTIATCTTDHHYLAITNTLNQNCWVTYNGVRVWWLPANASIFVDGKINQRQFRATKIIGIYHDGVQPTTGSIAVTLS